MESNERLYKHIQIDIKIAKDIFRDFHKNIDVESIKLIPEGMSTTNYIVNSKDNKKYLLKIYPENGSSMRKELEAYRYAEEYVNVPKILYSDYSMKKLDNTYLIMEYIYGRTLKKFIEDNNGFSKNMIFDIGKNLASLHQREYNSRGLLDEKLNLTRELPLIESYFKRVLNEYTGNHLGEEIKKNTNNYIDKNRDSLKKLEVRCVYAHGDFNPRNILVDMENKIYFIDFEYCLSESPYLDIGKFFRSRGDVERYMTESAKEEFINGYNSVARNTVNSEWEKLSGIRDLLSMLGFINTKNPPESWIESIKAEVHRVTKDN